MNKVLKSDATDPQLSETEIEFQTPFHTQTQLQFQF